MVSRYISFKLGEQTYGIDVLLVREVNQIHESTPVPLAPPYIHGLINLRGQIVTILDLAQRIDYGNSGEKQAKFNVILKSGQEIAAILGTLTGQTLGDLPDNIGIRVEDIGDVIDVASETMGPPPANVSDFNRHFIAGVFNLDATLLLVLNLNEVFKFA